MIMHEESKNMTKLPFICTVWPSYALEGQYKIQLSQQKTSRHKACPKFVAAHKILKKIEFNRNGINI